MAMSRLVLLSIVLLAACSPGSAESGGIVVADSAGIAMVESALGESTPRCTIDPEPVVTIGVAEGAPEYQLYRTFGARRLSDGRIAVVNQGSQELRFYDSAGRFLNAAGRAGEGPGEFSDAFILHVLPGDTLWVGDYRPWSWEVFAADGRWVRAVALQPPYMNATTQYVLDDGRMIVGDTPWTDAPVNRYASTSMAAMLHAWDGTLVDTVGVFESGRVGRFDDMPNFISSPMFDASARLVAGGDRMISGHTSRPELLVHEVGETVRVERIIRWTGEGRRVTPADVAAERQRLEASFQGDDPAMRARLLDPQIREERAVAERFPAYSSVVLGRDGRIWVRAYRMPGSEGTDEWLIFTPNGALQCRLQTDRFEQMPDFGSDYILVMRRDELGVERIFQHTLRGPAAAE